MTHICCPLIFCAHNKEGVCQLSVIYLSEAGRSYSRDSTPICYRALRCSNYLANHNYAQAHQLPTQPTH